MEVVAEARLATVEGARDSFGDFQEALFVVGSLSWHHYRNLKPQTLNTKPLIPKPLKPETLNPKATAEGSSRKGWLTKMGVVLHKRSRGEKVDHILDRFAEHPSMVPFLRKLDRDYATQGERCYRHWL